MKAQKALRIRAAFSSAVLIALALGAVVGCAEFRKEKGQRLTQLEPGYVPGYNTLAAGLFKNSCFSCHSAAGGNLGGTNLETYANALAFKDDIYADVVVNHTMPKNAPPLDENEQEMIRRWFNAGAPEGDLFNQNTGGTGKTVPDGGTDTPTLVAYAEVKHIFDPPTGCARCHSGEKPKGDVDLSTYANILANIKDVELDALVDKSMPPRGPLPDADQKLLRAWIDQGVKP